jgi:ferredoxin
MCCPFTLCTADDTHFTRGQKINNRSLRSVSKDTYNISRLITYIVCQECNNCTSCNIYIKLNSKITKNYGKKWNSNMISKMNLKSFCRFYKLIMIIRFGSWNKWERIYTHGQFQRKSTGKEKVTSLWRWRLRISRLITYIVCQECNNCTSCKIYIKLNSKITKNETKTTWEWLLIYTTWYITLIK